MVSVGIIGSLILFGIITKFFVLVFRGLYNDSDFDLKLGLLGYILAILAYNAVGLMFFFIPVVYMFSVAIGLLAKLSTLEDKTYPKGGLD